MTTKEAIEYITSTTREYEAAVKKCNVIEMSRITEKWLQWASDSIDNLRTAVQGGDKLSMYAFLWCDTYMSACLATHDIGPQSAAAAKLFFACIAIAKEADEYATSQD